MRQAGIIAAGALYALEHNIPRLAEDHDNARKLAQGLSEILGIRVEPVETNIVFFDLSGLGLTADKFNELIMAQGLRVSTMGNTRARAVTHLDVSPAQIEEALAIIQKVVRDNRPNTIKGDLRDDIFNAG
jgi:threonine aldolase